MMSNNTCSGDTPWMQRTSMSARYFTSVLFIATLATHVANAEPSQLPPEVGYNAGELETPRSAAMGGAVRAVSSSAEALYLNPAGMATARVYHLVGGAQIWPQAKRQTYGAAAVDSVVNRQHIAGGVSANWSQQDQDAVDRDWFDFRFALATPFSDRVFAGATLKYLSLTQGGAPVDLGLQPSLASSGLDGRPITTELTFDAGITARLGDAFWLGAVGSNLTDPGNVFLPMTFGGGIGYATSEYSFELDALSDFTSYERTRSKVMAGGEFLLEDSFPLRAGYRFDEAAKSHALSAGAGYIAPEFAIEAAVRGVVVGQPSITLVVGLRYHLDSGGETSSDD
jgi:hypothetical protein